MNEKELTQKDLREIEMFKNGFPWMKIIAAATPGHGIMVPNDELVNSCIHIAEDAMAGKLVKQFKIAKFVPASGAASRMFKDLFSKKTDVVNNFVSNIDKFAFYDEKTYAGVNKEEIVDFTLGPSGLDYGAKPKGVLKFHRYPDEVRTALAEHFVEAATYLVDANREANIIITISPEHQKLFENAIKDIQAKYEKKYDCKFNVELVYQYDWTDTIAVNPDNTPFIKEDGTVYHRPGGHGALIHNLNELDVDIVTIKNIDNVAVERLLPETAKWKKMLIGCATSNFIMVHNYIMALRYYPTQSLLEEVEQFLEDRFCITLPAQTIRTDREMYAKTLLSILERPLRVCGMVRNEGEPGGGPFIIREADGSTSLQILESAQIDKNNADDMKLLKESTHFNPVDLVCILKNGYGDKYDLTKFIDENAGFISSKSYQGRDLKALELPGLWNGAMSKWNTLFVEVPINTFNPVKTVMDLLRPAHQNEE